VKTDNGLLRSRADPLYQLLIFFHPGLVPKLNLGTGVTVMVSVKAICDKSVTGRVRDTDSHIDLQTDEHAQRTRIIWTIL